MRPALNIADLRRIAARRLPRGIFEYVDRGAADEIGLSGLRQAFDAVTFNPRVLVDVAARDLATELLGARQAMPLVIAPTAAAGLLWHRGEIALARAAAAAGIPFCIATESITAMEEIAAAAGGTPWFQLYVWQDQALSRALLDRARGVGIETLLLTVDTVAPPIREYNLRNGYGVPIRASLRGGIDMLSHPGWVWRVLLRYLRDGGMPRYQHYPAGQRARITDARTASAVRLSDALGWEDFRRLRRSWPGRLVLKGVLRADDARRAADAGADAIVVSSHGGRNLDGAVAPIRALPAIAASVGGRIEIIADSGVRRGGDALKLIALGARAVMVGRAALFGTAAGGEPGAARALAILRQEMLTELALLGCPHPRALDASFVNLPDGT